MITPEEVKSKTPETFWSKIKFGEPNECWEWQAGLRCKKSGYGGYRLWENGKGRTFSAHHFLFSRVVNSLPKRRCVCHDCDNRKCCNPNHLFEGTLIDNNKDMREKGRGSNPPIRYGSKNNMAKLTEDKVVLMRLRLAAGDKKAWIAKAFGINKATMTKIADGRAWKHVQI